MQAPLQIKVLGELAVVRDAQEIVLPAVKEDARFARLPGFGQQATTSRLSMPNVLERAGRSQSFAQMEPHEA